MGKVAGHCICVPARFCGFLRPGAAGVLVQRGGGYVEEGRVWATQVGVGYEGGLLPGGTRPQTRDDSNGDLWVRSQRETCGMQIEEWWKGTIIRKRKKKLKRRKEKRSLPKLATMWARIRQTLKGRLPVGRAALVHEETRRCLSSKRDQW